MIKSLPVHVSYTCSNKLYSYKMDSCSVGLRRDKLKMKHDDFNMASNDYTKKKRRQSSISFKEDFNPSGLHEFYFEGQLPPCTNSHPKKKGILCFVEILE